MRQILATLFTVVFLSGCFPTQISGARGPTEHTFKLLDSDLEYVEKDECAQDWVTGDAHNDLVTAHQMLDDRGVEIKPRRISGLSATAWTGKLKVPKNFYQRSERDQASLLSHELVHYCQRDELGDQVFEENYFNSAGRWRTEVPAYRQSYRTWVLQCTSIAFIEERIEAKLVDLRNDSFLWDIDQVQYEAETRRIWRSVLDEVPARCAEAS